MKTYNYFTIGDNDAYGQPQMPGKDEQPVGTIKLAIYTTSQAIQDNINYKNCSYIALTHDATVNDTYIIETEKERLKVLYVNATGRYKQVFLTNI
jgi:hypothetical protein